MPLHGEELTNLSLEDENEDNGSFYSEIMFLLFSFCDILKCP